MCAHYSKFIDFGKQINPQIQNDTNAANPLTYCITPSLNSQFFHGSSSSNQLYSTMNTSCTNFMAQRCSTQWDDYCDAYLQINTDNYWPNMAVIDRLAYQNANQFFQIRPTVGQNLLRNACYYKYIDTSDLSYSIEPFDPTVGQNLLRNACYYKYIDTSDLSYSIEPFDPTVANSPLIKIFQEYVSRYSTVIHLSDPEEIRKDTLIPKMLSHYPICMDVIGRIYLAFLRKEKGVHIENTPFQSFFQQHEKLLQLYVSQAVTTVPSFQLFHV